MSTAQSIIDKAELLLQDTTNIRYSEAELLGWLNHGLQEVANYKPSALVKTIVHQLVAGVLQKMPADSASLILITRNMGVDGATPGAAITSVQRTLMDSFQPNWTKATSSTTVKHYMYDPQGDDDVFYVYPPQPAVGMSRVQMQYYARPAAVTLTDELPFSVSYDPALLDYVLYRAYNKEIEQGDGVGLASAHYNAFLSALGGKKSAEDGTQSSTGR